MYLYIVNQIGVVEEDKDEMEEEAAEKQ